MKKIQLLNMALVSGALLVGADQAAASDYVIGQPVPEDYEGPMVHAGGLAVYPGLALTENYNDNILRSDVDKRSSAITVVSPSVLMQAKSAANVYTLSYQADLGRYASSSVDNYNDQNFTAVADWSLSSRASLHLSPQFISGHDDRGSTYTALTAVPSTWHKTGAEGEFVYGSKESIGRIVLDASRYDIRYQNNRSVTTPLDKNLSSFGGTFYYRLAPATFSFAEWTYTKIDYQDPASTLNGNEQHAMIGVTWNATAQTSGSFKIGQVWKNFDSPLRHDFTSVGWEGGVRWSPREYVRLDLLTSRSAAESTGVGSFVWMTNYSADLAYDVNDRTTVHLIAAQLTEDFTQTARTDKTPSYGVKIDHKLRKWLAVGAEYLNAVKSSSGYTGISPEYHNNIYTVYIRSEL